MALQASQQLQGDPVVDAGLVGKGKELAEQLGEGGDVEVVGELEAAGRARHRADVHDPGAVVLDDGPGALEGLRRPAHEAHEGAGKGHLRAAEDRGGHEALAGGGMTSRHVVGAPGRAGGGRDVDGAGGHARQQPVASLQDRYERGVVEQARDHDGGAAHRLGGRGRDEGAGGFERRRL